MKKRAVSKMFSVAFGTFAALGLLCMAALVVVLVLFGLSGENYVLYAILAGSFAGGALLFAPLAYLCLKKGEAHLLKERDELERADGEESFFVGENVLARFGKEELEICGKQLRIGVPYRDVKFYAVCVRHAPKEKGEWSVLIQFPPQYFPEFGPDDPSVLIQTDGKQRLYDCIAAHGLTLLGESPNGQNVKKKYERIKKFAIPIPVRRRRALIFSVLGALLFGGGIGFAFYLTAVGVPVAVIGAYLLARGGVAFLQAKQILAVYREGLFLRGETAHELCFLKWDEIVSMRYPKESAGPLHIECAYGEYDFPCPQAAYAFLKARFADKFGE